MKKRSARIIHKEELKRVWEYCLNKKYGENIKKPIKNKLENLYSGILESIETKKKRKIRIEFENKENIENNPEDLVDLDVLKEELFASQRDLELQKRDSILKIQKSVDSKFSNSFEVILPPETENNQIASDLNPPQISENIDQKIRTISQKLNKISENLPQTKQSFQSLSDTIQNFVKVPLSKTEKVIKETLDN